jgi:ABC-type lipoprotein export system ATPase subunit
VSVAVEIKDLFRVHQTAEGDAAALQGLSLSIREREVVTVLGPSGSGKSTFLRILAGLDRPSAGAVRVFGREIGKLPAREVAQYRTQTVGYADQHYGRALSPELTARELVGLELGLAGKPRSERERRADELLERVGLGDKRDARPAELSGGEQQRVAVARALAGRPHLIWADEPTGNVDSEMAASVMDLLCELHDEGLTLILVTHDPTVAARADRLITVKDGRIVADEALGTHGVATEEATVA